MSLDKIELAAKFPGLSKEEIQLILQAVMVGTSLNEMQFLHYQVVEEFIGRASFNEIQDLYCKLHGLLVEDAQSDSRFPWHTKYVYGDAGKCCADCAEIEMAIAVNIAASKNCLLISWFPEVASAVLLPN